MPNTSADFILLSTDLSKFNLIEVEGFRIYVENMVVETKVRLALNHAIKANWYSSTVKQVMQLGQLANQRGNIVIIVYDQPFIGRAYADVLLRADGSREIRLGTGASSIQERLIHEISHACLEIGNPTQKLTSLHAKTYANRMSTALRYNYLSCIKNIRDFDLQKKAIAHLLFESARLYPRNSQQAEMIANGIHALAASEELCVELAPDFTKLLKEYVTNEVGHKLKGSQVYSNPGQTQKIPIYEVTKPRFNGLSLERLNRVAYDLGRGLPVYFNSEHAGIKVIPDILYSPSYEIEYLHSDGKYYAYKENPVVPKGGRVYEDIELNDTYKSRFGKLDKNQLAMGAAHGFGIGLSIGSDWYRYPQVEEQYGWFARAGLAFGVGLVDYAAHYLAWSPVIELLPPVAGLMAAASFLAATPLNRTEEFEKAWEKLKPHHFNNPGPEEQEWNLIMYDDPWGPCHGFTAEAIKELGPEVMIALFKDTYNENGIMPLGDWINANINAPISEVVHQPVDALFSPSQDGRKKEAIHIDGDPREFLPRFDYNPSPWKVLGNSRELSLPGTFKSLQDVVDDKLSPVFNTVISSLPPDNSDNNYHDKTLPSSSQMFVPSDENRPATFKFDSPHSWWKAQGLPDGKAAPVVLPLPGQSHNKPHEYNFTFNVFRDGAAVVGMNTTFGSGSGTNNGKKAGQTKGSGFSPQGIFEAGAGAVITQFAEHFAGEYGRQGDEKHWKKVHRQLRAIFPKEICEEINGIIKLINKWKVEPYDPENDPRLKGKNKDDPYWKRYIEEKKRKDPALKKNEKDKLLSCIRVCLNNFWEKFSRDLPSVRGQYQNYLDDDHLKIRGHHVCEETKYFIRNFLFPALDKLDNLLPNLDAFVHFYENGLRLEILNAKFNTLCNNYSNELIDKKKFENDKNAINAEYKIIMGEVNNYLESIRENAGKAEKRSIDKIIKSNDRSTADIDAYAKTVINDRRYTEKCEICNDAEKATNLNQNAYFQALKAGRKAGCELIRMSHEPQTSDFENTERNHYIFTQEGIWYFDSEAKTLTKLALLDGKTLTDLSELFNLREKRTATDRDLACIASVTGHAREGAISSQALTDLFISYKNTWMTEKQSLEALLSVTPSKDTEARQAIQNRIQNGENNFNVNLAQNDYLRNDRKAQDEYTIYLHAVEAYNRKEISEEQLNGFFSNYRESKLIVKGNLQTWLLKVPEGDNDRPILHELINNVDGILSFESTQHDRTLNDRLIEVSRNAFLGASAAGLSDKEQEEIFTRYLDALKQKKTLLETLKSMISSDDEKTKEAIQSDISSVGNQISNGDCGLKFFYVAETAKKFTDDYNQALEKYLNDPLGEDEFLATCKVLSKNCNEQLQPATKEILSSPGCTPEIQDELKKMQQNTSFEDRGHQQIIFSILGKVWPGMGTDQLMQLFSKVDVHLQAIVDTDNYSIALLVKGQVAMRHREFTVARVAAEILLEVNSKNHKAFLLLIDVHLSIGTDAESILSLMTQHEASFTDKNEQLINDYYRSKALGDETSLLKSFEALSQLDRDSDERLEHREDGLVRLEVIQQAKNRLVLTQIADRSAVDLMLVPQWAAHFGDITQCILEREKQNDKPDAELLVLSDTLKTAIDKERLEKLKDKQQAVAEQIEEYVEFAQSVDQRRNIEHLSRAHLLIDVGSRLYKKEIKKLFESKFGFSKKQARLQYDRLNQIIAKSTHWASSLIQNAIRSMDPMDYIQNNTGMSEEGIAAFRQYLQNKPAVGIIQSAHNYLSQYNASITAVQLTAVLADFMAEWLADESKKIVTQASSNVRIATDAYTNAQMTMSFYLLFTANTDRLTMARNATTTFLNLGWAHNLIHKMNSHVDGSISDSYHYHFFNLLIKHMYGSVWQQLFFIHEDTILNVAKESLLRIGQGKIADFMAIYQPWILGGTFALRLLKGVIRANEETEKQVVDARIHRLGIRFDQISSWMKSVGGAGRREIRDQAANMYAALKHEAEHLNGVHSEKTRFYVTALITQHLFAETVKTITLNGDGNGLFKAVSAYTEESAEELRNKSVDYIRAHREEIKYFIAVLANQTMDEAFNNYLAQIAQAGEPGDAIVIHALSKVLQRPIIILFDGMDPDLKRQGLGQPDSIPQGKPIFVLYKEVDSVQKFYHVHALHLNGELYFENQHERNLNKPERPLYLPLKVIDTTPLSLAITSDVEAGLKTSRERFTTLTQVQNQKASTSVGTRALLVARRRQRIAGKAAGEPLLESSGKMLQLSGDVPVLPSSLLITESRMNNLQTSRERFSYLTGITPSNVVQPIQSVEKHVNKIEVTSELTEKTISPIDTKKVPRPFIPEGGLSVYQHQMMFGPAKASGVRGEHLTLKRRISHN